MKILQYLTIFMLLCTKLIASSNVLVISEYMCGNPAITNSLEISPIYATFDKTYMSLGGIKTPDVHEGYARFTNAYTGECGVEFCCKKPTELTFTGWGTFISSAYMDKHFLKSTDDEDAEYQTYSFLLSSNRIYVYNQSIVTLTGFVSTNLAYWSTNASDVLQYSPITFGNISKKKPLQLYRINVYQFQVQ